MPQAAAVLATVGPAVSTIATVGSLALSASAMRQQRRAAELQQRQQEVATQRSRRQAIRAAQIQRAQALSTAEASGGIGGSAIQGGLSSLSSQLGGSLGYSTQMSGLSGQIGAASSRAQTLSGISSLFSDIGGLDFGQSPSVDLTQGPVQ